MVKKIYNAKTKKWKTVELTEKEIEEINKLFEESEE